METIFFKSWRYFVDNIVNNNKGGRNRISGFYSWIQKEKKKKEKTLIEYQHWMGDQGIFHFTIN